MLLENRKKKEVSPPIKPIPKFLSPVRAQHLKDLERIRMECNANPGGDCLSSCTTMHISYTDDKSERTQVNRRINHHIADNFDTYYCNKISLPYCETVGVGNNARQVTCNTREELLNFLRSEDSLCANSNYQEVLAISNMLNIKIFVFTYGIGGDDKNCTWRTIFPDPKMAASSEFAPGTVPDMFLYNSANSHYNLLVEDNSRLAVLGLISMGEVKEVKEHKEVGVDIVTDKSIEEPWKTVKTKNKKY